MPNHRFRIALRAHVAALLMLGAGYVAAQSPDSLVGPPGVRPESVVREWSAAERLRF